MSDNDSNIIHVVLYFLNVVLTALLYYCLVSFQSLVALQEKIFILSYTRKPIILVALMFGAWVC